MSRGFVLKHKPYFLAVLFIIIALVAVPLSSIVSTTSLQSDSIETTSYGSKIERHYFTSEEIDLINLKINGAS